MSGQAEKTAGSEKRRYGLFVRRTAGIGLKQTDEGVGLLDGQLFWSSQTGEVARPLSDVTGVHLSVVHVPSMAISAIRIGVWDWPLHGLCSGVPVKVDLLVRREPA